MGENISDKEDKEEEINSSVQEDAKSKKYPGNLGHYEKTKPKNNRNRRIRRNPGERHRKYF